MLLASFALLSLVLLLGLTLVVLHGARRMRRVPLLGKLHGGLGAAGAALFAVSMHPSARAAEMGVGAFGIMGVVLLGVALLAGLLAWRLRVRHSDPLLAIGLHATLAVFGLALLAAYVAAATTR